MARSRNIKPGFFLNDDLAQLEMAARLLFAGLWTIADREGRLEDRPLRIKAEVLPYDPCNVDTLLNDLHQGGFITRYKHGGNAYIQINNFTKHQNPHKNEAESVIPPPEELAQYKYSTSTVLAPEMHSTNPADSLNLIPDSLNLIPDSLFSAPGDAEKNKPPRKPFKNKQQEALFDMVWEVFPKKKSKGQAERTWVKLDPDEQLVAIIIAKIKQAETSREWLKDNGEYIPHLSTWLNNKGWLDEYSHGGIEPKTTQSKMDFVDQYFGVEGIDSG